MSERRALIVAVPDASFQRRPREGCQVASCDECERQVWLAPSSQQHRLQLLEEGFTVDVRCPVCTVTTGTEYENLQVNSATLRQAMEELSEQVGQQSAQDRTLIALAIQQYQDQRRREEGR